MNYNYAANAGVSRKKLAKRLLFAAAIIAALSAVFVFMQPQGEPTLKFVSGTAYIAGEKGQVITRLNDRFGNPIPNANCRATIAYPDKTYFLIDTSMQPSSITGNYFVEFITPSKLGIYEEIVRCDAIFNGNVINLTVSSSFQVSLALSLIVNLTEKLGSVESNLLAVNNTIIQTFNQTSERLNNVESNLTSMNRNINTVNDTVNGRFSKFYDDMYNVSVSLGSVFSNKKL